MIPKNLMRPDFLKKQRWLGFLGNFNGSVARISLIGLLLLGFLASAYLFIPQMFPAVYRLDDGEAVAGVVGEELASTTTEKVFVATHLPTPKPLRAIYMTSWVAGTGYWRDSLKKLVKETELNAVVIDIKDYSGTIAFDIENSLIDEIAAEENRIPDIKEFIVGLHENGIYVIGRMQVFQDPKLVKARPDLAVKRESDGGVWKDHKGLSWIDAGARFAWDYNAAIAEESYKLGFDEINFDYIRFPSDGNMKDISYPFSEERIVADPVGGKSAVIREFFSYIREKLHDKGIILSADLFGMTTTNADDLNIGQRLEDALSYFDYVAPMVYPSHYPPTFLGYANPTLYPYEVVKYSMDSAVVKVNNLLLATTTVSADIGERVSKNQLRPWLQDFDYRAVYGPEEVRAQIQATYDAGLDSWMLWDAANKYTPSALLPE